MSGIRPEVSDRARLLMAVATVAGLLAIAAACCGLAVIA